MPDVRNIQEPITNLQVSLDSSDKKLLRKLSDMIIQRENETFRQELIKFLRDNNQDETFIKDFVIFLHILKKTDITSNDEIQTDTTNKKFLFYHYDDFYQYFNNSSLFNPTTYKSFIDKNTNLKQKEKKFCLELLEKIENKKLFQKNEKDKSPDIKSWHNGMQSRHRCTQDITERLEQWENTNEPLILTYTAEENAKPDFKIFNRFMEQVGDASRCYDAIPIFSLFESDAKKNVENNTETGIGSKKKTLDIGYTAAFFLLIGKMFDVNALKQRWQQYWRKYQHEKKTREIEAIANELLYRNLKKVKTKLEGEEENNKFYIYLKRLWVGISCFFILPAGLFEVLDGIATVLGMAITNPIIFFVAVGILAVFGMIAFISFEVVNYLQELGINPSFNLHEPARYKKIKQINDLLLEILELTHKSTALSSNNSLKVNPPLIALISIIINNSKLSLFATKNPALTAKSFKQLPLPQVLPANLSRYFYITKENGQLSYLDQNESEKISFDTELGIVTYGDDKQEVKFDIKKFRNNHKKNWLKETIFSKRGVEIVSAVLTGVVALIEGSGGYFLGFGVLAALGIATGPIAPIVLGIIGAIGLTSLGLIINYFAIKRLLNNFSKDAIDVMADLEEQHELLAAKRKLLHSVYTTYYFQLDKVAYKDIKEVTITTMKHNEASNLSTNQSEMISTKGPAYEMQDDQKNNEEKVIPLSVKAGFFKNRGETLARSDGAIHQLRNMEESEESNPLAEYLSKKKTGRASLTRATKSIAHLEAKDDVPVESKDYQQNALESLSCYF